VRGLCAVCVSASAGACSHCHLPCGSHPGRSWAWVGVGAGAAAGDSLGGWGGKVGCHMSGPAEGACGVAPPCPPQCPSCCVGAGVGLGAALWVAAALLAVLAGHEALSCVRAALRGGLAQPLRAPAQPLRAPASLAEVDPHRSRSLIAVPEVCHHRLGQGVERRSQQLLAQ
jgi:hypothetical protein